MAYSIRITISYHVYENPGRQEIVRPCCKIVDCDVKHQHNQTNIIICT